MEQLDRDEGLRSDGLMWRAGHGRRGIPRKELLSRRAHPHADGALPVNILTGAGYDPVTDTAELKVWPVCVEPCQGPAAKSGDVAAD